MYRILKRLWHDDSGAVLSTELTLVLGLGVFGLVPGLATLRNKINAGLGSVVDPLQPVLQQSAIDARTALQTPAPFVAKSQSNSTSNAAYYSHSASNVNVFVNVQYPGTRNDIPSP